MQSSATKVKLKSVACSSETGTHWSSRTASSVGGDADGTNLQCLGINADVQAFATGAGPHAVLFALPLAFAQELDARGVHQQVLPRWTALVRHLHI